SLVAVLVALIAGVGLTAAFAQAAKKEVIVLEILVPEDARGEIEGTEMKVTGAVRHDKTPPVAVGGTDSYVLKATSSGQQITRKLRFRHGEKNTFDLRDDFGARADTPLTEKEALELGTEAYVYGYPLVTVEMTRRVMTNAAEPKGMHGPMG